MTYVRPNFFSELANGQETFSRQFTTTTLTLSSANCRTAFFTARKTETTTQVRFAVSTAASGGTNGVTYCYIGLYTVGDDNAMTRVAITNNETTILNSTGLKTVSWASSYPMVKGRRYALALTATYDSSTVPQVWGTNCGPGGESEAVPALAALLSTTSNAPKTSYDAATVTASTANFAPYFVVLP